MDLSIFSKFKKFYLALFVLFLLSFNINIFGVGLGPQWFNNFDPTSEEMTHRTISCAADGVYKGNLVNINPNKSKTDFCKVYPSQFGMQGYIYGALGAQFSGSEQQHYIIEAMQVLLTVGMTLVLLLFVGFAHMRYGKRVALFVSVLLMFSVWLVGYANQMYWVAFLFLIPFNASLYLYPIAKKKKFGMPALYGLLFALFLLKFLNGYEYLGAVSLSAVIPLFYWESVQTKTLNYKKLLMRSAAIIICSVVAFVSALALNVTSMINDYGSASAAVEAISGRGEARSVTKVREAFPTTIYNFITMQPEVYSVIDTHKDVDALYSNRAGAWVYIAIMILSYLLMPVITLPVDLHGLIGVLLQSFIFWAILAFIAVRWNERRGVLTRQEARGFRLIFTLGLLGIVSWHVLFTEHAFVHAHIVAISYYIPYMLWVYLAVSIMASDSVDKVLQRLSAKTAKRQGGSDSEKSKLRAGNPS